MTSIEIEAADVVRLIEQYLKENNLLRSLAVLQEETGVLLNTVDSLDAFVGDIQAGHWDKVLKSTQPLQLPPAKLGDLYEQIVIELIELRELAAARLLLRQTEPMLVMKQQQPERYARLEQLQSRSYIDLREVYADGQSKEKRRAAIAQQLAAEISVVPSARLISLLAQALKWQQHQGLLPPGTQIDLFRGKAAMREQQEETYPTTLARHIKFGASAYPLAATFSPDGQYLVSGSRDGFIEVWNYMNGKLRQDLKYQAQDNLMVMDEDVTAIAFSRDSELLAAGARDGKIRVFRITTGECVRRIQAHSQLVSAVRFSRDAQHVLSASNDGLVRVHGLKSGKLMKEMRGHSSFVTDAHYADEATPAQGTGLAISGGADGTVRLWTLKTCECAAVWRVAGDTPVVAVVPVALGAASSQQSSSGAAVGQVHFIVANRSPTLHLVNMQGQVVRTLSSGKRDGGDIVAISVSPRAGWLYAAAEDRTLYCFSLTANQLESTIPLMTEGEQQKAVLGVVHHPHQNMLATFGEDALLRIWND